MLLKEDFPPAERKQKKVNVETSKCFDEVPLVTFESSSMKSVFWGHLILIGPLSCSMTVVAKYILVCP